jgi:hypothetical protein
LVEDFSAHKTDTVKVVASSLNVHLMFIPPGLTGHLQPADIAWNRPFKSYLRQEWQADIMDQIPSSNLPKWKLVQPSRKKISLWIYSSWNKLNAATIINGLKKPNYHSSNDNIQEPIAHVIQDEHLHPLLQALNELGLLEENFQIQDLHDDDSSTSSFSNED